MQDHRMSHHTGQVLTLAQHDAPVAGPLAGPAADPSIARSWLRCLRQHGLDPANASAPAVLEAARIRERRGGCSRCCASPTAKCTACTASWPAAAMWWC